jgi:geranylgeranyl reductase family protein
LSKRETDIVIVGAGPSGATASLFLSKAGIPHTILDKATFPRDKVCGDALSGKVVSVLNKLDTSLISEIGNDSQHYTPSWGVSFVAPNGKNLDIPFSSRPQELEFAPGYISRRIDFDNWLVSHLDESTANVRLGEGIESIERGDDGVVIQTSQEEIKAKLVIGAEGDRSIVAKELGSFSKENQHYCAGLRVYYKGIKNLHPENFIELHFMKRVLPGYFWIFPMPNGTANVGLGVLSSEVSKRKLKLKDILEDIIANEPAMVERFEGAERIDDIRGWGLPLGSKRRELSGDNFMLTGDAASLIDPFTGEGIGNGMLSGMIAAQTAAKGDFSAAALAAYDAEVYRHLWGELKLSHKLQQLVHYPWLFNLVVNKARRNKTLQETFMAMFEDLDIRQKLKNPMFYLKLLFG